MQCHNFNKDWTFEKADQADRLKAFYGNSNAVVVTLPHDAMIREKRDKDCPSGAQSGFYPGGVYTYEKKFMAQNEWKKQDVFLEFEGIYGIARVWINGSLAAVNRNGYMGFSVDLKPWISYEHENIIRIDVDNSKQPNSRWYSGSGIYRDVNLWTGKDVYISHDKLRITTLSVNDDMAVIEVCAQLKNIIGHGLEAECLIEIKKDGQKTASDTQRVVFRSEQMQTVRVQIPIEHPKKWSPKQPALYECHITTKFDDKICDEAVSYFGTGRTNRKAPCCNKKHCNRARRQIVLPAVSCIRTIPLVPELHRVSTLAGGRGLYRQWGIAPRPETNFLA